MVVEFYGSHVETGCYVVLVGIKRKQCARLSREWRRISIESDLSISEKSSLLTSHELNGNLMPKQ
jgi:hypothetical protein